MSRYTSFVAVATAGVVGYALLVVTACNSAAPIPPANPTIKIRIALDKGDVAPGEPVRLEETVPAAWSPEVTTITHRVYRTGQYDPQSQGIVHLPPRNFVDTLGLFAGDDGLTTFTRNSSPRVPGDLCKGRKGVAYVFKPNRVGVFLIYAEWDVKGERAKWLSPPAVLVVSPPTDAQGRLVLKSDWLEQD